MHLYRTMTFKDSDALMAIQMDKIRLNKYDFKYLLNANTRE